MLFGKNFKDQIRQFLTSAARKVKVPKIICTLGTTTDDETILRDMIKEGMACARINTAYADTAHYKKRIDMLRSIADIPVILDLKGSQIRVVADGTYSIEAGSEFPVGFGRGSIAFNYDFYEEIFPGDLVLFENGTIKTVVAEKKKHYLMLKVLEEGEGYVKNHMGVNIPYRVFQNIPQLSPKDIEIIVFGLEERVDFFAMSFVRTVRDVLYVHNIIESKKAGYAPGIKVKIEDSIGADNLNLIISASQQKGIALSVMIGRGDLFVEAPQTRLALIQKKIVRTCNERGIPVDVATGLLESMQYRAYPTRSEVCDATNAILDGADWLMLSAETSNSQYPVEAVRMLACIIKEVTE